MQDNGSKPRERQENEKSQRQRASMPVVSVTHYGYSVPLVRMPCVPVLLADFRFYFFPP